jgi:hypothetical protein
MNGQNFEKRSDETDIVENSDKDVNNPVKVKSDSDTGQVPWNAALIHTDPMVEHVVPVDRKNKTVVQEAPILTDAGSRSVALLDHEISEHLRTRWNEIQGRFVDEPRSAVQQADELVSEVIEKITQMFGDEHSSLEGQWKQVNNVTTEDLRKALQRYRSFFNRLVV